MVDVQNHQIGPFADFHRPDLLSQAQGVGPVAGRQSQRVLAGDASLPASHVAAKNGDTLFFIDRAAAKSLSPSFVTQEYK